MLACYDTCPLWSSSLNVSSRFPPLPSSQRQRLIHSSRSQLDGEAGPGSDGNNLKSVGSCGLENGGRGAGIGDQEMGDKSGVGVCQQEEDGDEDGIFSPVRIPSEGNPTLTGQKKTK